VEYYDKGFRPVTRADVPGRYGAVVEITPENGRSTRRFRTLFRLPEALPWTGLGQSIGIQRRFLLGPHRDMRGRPAVATRTYLRRLIGGNAGRGSADIATILAGLYETQAGDPPSSASHNVWVADRQWWVTLKRKLYGTAREFPKPFVCPGPLDGGPAPAVREGTLEEAGMKADAAERIASVCREWAAGSDLAFAVCVVRHGVIVLHRAYGVRGERPMTTTTKSRVASITKLLSGTLMMMLIDQGRVGLDEPVAKYLAPLRGIELARRPTIRQLYNHTSGFQGHWGDYENDLEELVAGEYRDLNVGEKFEYSGLGYALGGKIIEAVTGEAIPQFYKRHLLDPLGCEHTDVAGTHGDAMSVPLDMARIGQMLLNRGAYGSMLFFSEQTFGKMLPPAPSPAEGGVAHEDPQWMGIGAWWMNGRYPGFSGLSARAFGHAAGSGATFLVEPERDLVIVMTRNGQDRDHAEWQQRFLDAIHAGVAEGEAG
jgi:CubicO group peptidase (beta-lactamase class C family)